VNTPQSKRLAIFARGWQGASVWTAVAERSADTASRVDHRTESGVALRFPPHSKDKKARSRRAGL